MASKKVLAIRRKSSRKSKQAPTPLSLEEITLFERLPVLTIEQIARVLQKTVAQVHEMSRARAGRPLPVFRSGRTIVSTWLKIQQWIDEGFEQRKAA